MVIAIIGLMVGGGLMAFAPMIEKARENQTAATLDQLEQALVLFAIQNGRLPCPADGSQINTSATYGLEPTPPPTGGAACTTTVANSVIPWRTLGIDESYSIDGWSDRISYFPANGGITGVSSVIDDTTTPGSGNRICGGDASGITCTLCISRTIATTSGASTRETLCDPTAATGLTPSYPYGNYIAVYVAANPYGLELTTANPAGNPSTTLGTNYVGLYGQRAAYVLISHGQSGWYGWNKAGNQIQPPNANYTLKKYNSGIAGSFAGTPGNLGFVQGNNQFINTKSNQGFFDDIVRWRSPAFIIQNCGSGACGNP